MNKLNELVADLIEAVTGLNINPDCLYFKYKDRQFRASVHDDADRLEICDGNFDRWANSSGAHVAPCPLTSNGMDLAFKFLLSSHVIDKG